MRLGEELATLAARYQREMQAARRHPCVSLTGASGIKRDRAQAKARARYKKGLLALGLPPVRVAKW